VEEVFVSSDEEDIREGNNNFDDSLEEDIVHEDEKP